MNGHQKQKEQSCRMLEEALFSLMREKNYDEITVSEIAKRADVARRTFYRMYTDKGDMIDSCFRKLLQEYQRRYEALDEYDIPRIAQEYFSFWYEHREFLLLLLHAGMEDQLYCRLRRAASEVIKVRIGNSRLQEMPEMKYFADYSAGGFVNLLCAWIENGMEEPPEVYARKVSDAICMFIRQ